MRMGREGSFDTDGEGDIWKSKWKEDEEIWENRNFGS